MTPRLIAFDLNKTLINENSWYDLNVAMGVTPEEDAELMRMAAAGEITDAEGQRRLLAMYRERGDVSRRNIERILGAYTYMAYAQETVQSLQSRGYEIAIISGAMDVLVRMVAEDLGVTVWRASNVCHFDANQQLVRIDAPISDENDKLRQLQELAAQRYIRVQDCMVVGDGANDAALFAATGNGVTFADSAIKEQARWVIRNLAELPDIVD